MKNIFKKHKRGGSDKSRKIRKKNNILLKIIQEAYPGDFRVYPEAKTLYLMSEPVETIHQWVLAVRDSKRKEYILGRFASKEEAEKEMSDVIEYRLLITYHTPTLRELLEQQEVA